MLSVVWCDVLCCVACGVMCDVCFWCVVWHGAVWCVILVCGVVCGVQCGMMQCGVCGAMVCRVVCVMNVVCGDVSCRVHDIIRPPSACKRRSRVLVAAVFMPSAQQKGIVNAIQLSTFLFMYADSLCSKGK